MDGANLTQRGTALPGLQVWDTAPSTHSPHLIFWQIFITINLAWLHDIKILHTDNLSLNNRLRSPAAHPPSIPLVWIWPEDQVEKVTSVVRRWLLMGQTHTGGGLILGHAWVACGMTRDLPPPTWPTNLTLMKNKQCLIEGGWMDYDLLYHNVTGRFYCLESAFVFFCFSV